MRSRWSSMTGCSRPIRSFTIRFRSRQAPPGSPRSMAIRSVVNGKSIPYLEVEPRKYRLRILNGSNGRFFALALSSGQPFYQIGTDQGLLPSPVVLRNILLFPAERADVVVDFAGKEGQRIVLKHQSKEVMQFRVLSGGPKEPARSRIVCAQSLL